MYFESKWIAVVIECVVKLEQVIVSNSTTFFKQLKLYECGLLKTNI